MKGTVKWYNTKKNYGFIVGEDGGSYFVHESNIKLGRQYSGFNADDEVVFDLGTGRKGKTQAEHVSLIDDNTEVGERHTGKIKWFDMRKRYGFIEEDANTTQFVHASCIDNGRAYLTLEKDDEVEFTPREGSKGSQAVDVTIVE